MLKIGHRGASAHFPENTLLAFRKALEMGADAIECDVHLCASGEPVVIHDNTLKRTTGISGYVARHSLKELRKLDAGKGEPIPTLEEVLLTIAPHAAVFIEIKASAATHEVAHLIKRLAKTRDLPYSQMPVISFKAQHLNAVKAYAPQAYLGITPSESPTALSSALIKRAVAANLWSINPGIKVLSCSFVKEAQAHGLKIFTWTANTATDIRKARSCGVDGIMSDYPEKL